MAKSHDSTTHNEERRAKMQAEAEESRQEDATAAVEREAMQTARDSRSRQEENNLLDQHASLIAPGESRDQLLDRIREMRENTPQVPQPVGFMSDAQKAQRQAEEEAGAAAVARAEKQLEESKEYRKKAEAERLAREGTMAEIHHPNPGQDEQFPALKATLGKTRK